MAANGGVDGGTGDGDTDRFAAAAGTLAALGVFGASLLPWTEATRVGAIENPFGVVLGVVLVGVFGARSLGYLNRRAGLCGTVGGAVAVVLALVALVFPVLGPRTGTVTPGLGVSLGAGAGAFALGFGLADWFGLGRRAVVERLGAAASAGFVGAVALFVGALAATVVQSVGRGLPTLLLSGLANAAFAVVLGFVGMGVVVLRRDDVRFFDVRVPSRREWGYAVGGLAAMLGLLLLLNEVIGVLGLPSAEHSVITQARENPQLLFVLFVLSWVAIGPGEELLNRNVVQKYLYYDFSRASAIVVGCIVFTAMHGFAYAGSGTVPLVVSLVNLFCISLVLGVVYERTDNVVVPIFAHAAYDAVQFAAAYVMITTDLL
ncbi:CPBP family intramembrane glutamic endopeptidase [Halospeciosus flavus]|uniref:CPBP family intramembrane glutamic endopeptidase n=1 Tax=Halospeciosus flavus TaxID=3032283 RepID=A0ABD5Z8M9_9EURY|nr:type II CAAX endopeptidase family protein [Halospeciosus flavus]